MKIIIEEYPYAPTEEVHRVLRGLVEDLENVEGRLRVNYVGYFYNPTLKDTVFCLPKVVLQEGKDDKTEKVFGLYRPEDLLNCEYWDNKVDTKYKDFLFGLSVWIYRAINVYQHQFKDSDIVLRRQVQIAGHGKKSIPDTYLDVLLALIQFNQDNRDFLLFTLKNIHSGCNKINWTKTISHSNAIIQNDIPIYIDLVNKRKQINFDEELLVIYYSILEYLHKQYGFSIHIDYNFNTLSEGQFAQYMDGLGRSRLKQIKYKYFSDKALELWQLCYAFFDHNYEIAITSDQRQYLLVKNFNIVFEAMIDKLIGTPIDDLPNELKEQKDGKIVDHLYKDTSLSALINATETQKQVYYIGDSKYYKMHREVGTNSEYKQYTYAKNIIHYNLDLFLRSQQDEKIKEGRDFLAYRDSLTEGYEITPNFFISADIDEELNYNEKLTPIGEVKMTRQFENRLFDRDTLLLSHYDVNFLHILSLYARDKFIEQDTWKASVRKRFREQIQAVLTNKFDFFAMAPHADVNTQAYIQEHFKDIIGRVYTPYKNKEICSLGLDKNYPQENETIRAKLSESFYIVPCSIGEDPTNDLVNLGYTQGASQSSNVDPQLLMVMMENFEVKSAKFLTNGIIAVALKSNVESKLLEQQANEIQLILFHAWQANNYHIYPISKIEIVRKNKVDKSIYKNMTTGVKYMLVNFDSSNAIKIDGIAPEKKTHTSSNRYDARLATINELRMLTSFPELKK